MRLTTIIAAVLLLAVASAAQVPHILSYQAVVRDGAGTPVADGTYDISFAIYDVSSGGTELWSETQALAVTDGIVSASLGVVTPLALAFDSDYWLGVSVEGEAELMPRVYLTAAPYAIRAAVADTVEGLEGFSLPFEGSASLGNPAFKVTNDGMGNAVYGMHSTSDHYGFLGGDSHGVYGGRIQTYGGMVGFLGGNTYGAYGKADFGFDMANEGHLGGPNYGAYGENFGGKYGALGATTYGVYGNGGGTYGYAGGFDGHVEVNGLVTISDFLKLEPRADYPSSPSDGMLCVVGTAPDYHLYVYLNEHWRQLDVGK